MHHPFQNLPPETFDALLHWSRIGFWVVFALFTWVHYETRRRTHTTSRITPDVILAVPPEQAGIFRFWIAFDYPFMVAYTLFFSVCCVWAAGRFAPDSVFHTLGILLAWAQVPQLLIDMSENYCMWQIAGGRHSAALERSYRFLAKAKIPLFAAAVAYVLVVSVLYWCGWL